MRERVTVDKLYKFDELSERAKDTAREWYRNGIDFADFGADSVIDDAIRMASLIGINLCNRPVKLMNGSTRMAADICWAVADRSAGADYTGSYSYVQRSVRKVAAEAPSEWTNRETGAREVSQSNTELNRIANELADVQRRNFYQVQASISRRRSSGFGRDFGLDIDVERADEKELSDEDAETVKTALQDFADWIHSALEREYEWMVSDEAVDENIIANEYEFTEEGERA